MQLTDDEIKKTREIFFLPEDAIFDVYYKEGSNRELASIDVHPLFDPVPNNIKTTITNGKLIVAIIKSSTDEVFTYIGDSDFLTPGVI